MADAVRVRFAVAVQQQKVSAARNRFARQAAAAVARAFTALQPWAITMAGRFSPDLRLFGT